MKRRIALAAAVESHVTSALRGFVQSQSPYVQSILVIRILSLIIQEIYRGSY